MPPPKPRSRLRREAERAEPDRAASLCKRSIPEPEQRAGPFLSRYGLKRLVDMAFYERITDAIQRESNRKQRPRAWKAQLIVNANPGWAELFETLNQ